MNKMNYSNIVIWDLETTSVDTNTAQIVQIGAVAVDGRRLEIIPNSEFNILVKPLYGLEAARANLQELTDATIKIHGKTEDMLNKNGVSIEAAIENFESYVRSYSSGSGKWNLPISSGYNIINYDHKILNRVLNATKRSSFFHPSAIIDVMQIMFLFFENDKNVKSLSADNLIRGYMGYSKGKAHDALSDVIMCAEVMCKSLRLIRNATQKTKFEGCFKC